MRKRRYEGIRIYIRKNDILNRMGAMASVCSAYTLCVEVSRPLSPPGRDLNRLAIVSVSMEGVFVCFLVLEGLDGVA